MLSAFANTLKIPALRDRILFTLAMVVIVRIGAAITLPGVDAGVLKEWMKYLQDMQSQGEAGLMALLNVFSGGGLTNCAVLALGIMPYISASIMMQLLTAVVPKLSKMAREDGGRQKVTQYTRYLTIILCVFQGFMLAKSLENPAANPFLPGLNLVQEQTGLPLVPNAGLPFELLTVLVICAGTMLLMWIGEQITEKGIGNGISLIITVNIISGLPFALTTMWNTYIQGAGRAAPSPMTLVAMLVFLVIVIAAVIAITQAQRRIPIQHAKRVVGRKVMGGQSSFLPLKVNYSGVMPIIFATAILLFPPQILHGFASGRLWLEKALSYFQPNNWVYYGIAGLLIFFFSYFWVATMFQPNQIADDLKKSGGYIPGVRPGKPTADFLDYTMGRLTFAGALFLTVLFLIPQALNYFLNVPTAAGQFFGGTSLLILVGVLLDIMRQVETHLIEKHYDGFLRKGKIRGRSARPGTPGGGATATGTNMLWLYFILACMLVVGAAYLIYRSASGQ